MLLRYLFYKLKTRKLNILLLQKYALELNSLSIEERNTSGKRLFGLPISLSEHFVVKVCSIDNALVNINNQFFPDKILRNMTLQLVWQIS